MSYRKTVSVVCAGMVFAAFSAPAQTNTTQSATTTNTQTSTASLPPVGLASTETAQVNLVNTVPAPSSGPAPSCTGSVAFYAAGGSLIGAATGFTVASGQIFSVKLPYDLAEASGGRTVVRAEIVLTVQSGSNSQAPYPPPACILVSSLETYDTATGVTHAFVSGGTAQGLPLNIRTLQIPVAPPR
jgi:hypothetical protein